MFKIVDESILVFPRVSLSKFSLEALYFMGIMIFIVEYVRNVKSHFFEKQGILATQSSRKAKSLVHYVMEKLTLHIPFSP